jgi:hypothetical protein
LVRLEQENLEQSLKLQTSDILNSVDKIINQNLEEVMTDVEEFSNNFTNFKRKFK